MMIYLLTAAPAFYSSRDSLLIHIVNNPVMKQLNLALDRLF